MLSSSVCTGNLMEFLEGHRYTILKQFSTVLCQNHPFCAAMETFFSHQWQFQKHPDADNFENGKAFQWD